MYQVNQVTKLNGKEFYDISVWNMFGRKKIFAILLLLIYGIGLYTVVSAIPNLKTGNTNGFILNGGIGLIMTFVGVYMGYSNVSRFKRISRNEEQLNKTEKHIKMDENEIINYRSSVGEQISYQWAQLTEAYDRPEAIIFCMKDGQLLYLKKENLSENEVTFIHAKVDVLMKWRKTTDMRIWIATAAFVTAFAAVTAVLYWMAV